MKELIEKWLSLFGSPGVFSFEDTKTGEKIRGMTSTYQTLDSLIKVNDTKHYGIHFSPNGNYGLLNRVGEPIVRKKELANSYISCFYIDVDKRDSSFNNDEDKKNLLKYLISFIEDIKLRVSFISETPGGFHLWMFVEPNDREQLGRILTNDDYKLIQENLASRIDGGDKNSHGFAKLMRCPFTNHWKTGLAEQVKLYTTNIEKTKDDAGEIWKVNLKEVTSPDQIVVPEDMYARKEWIINFVKTLKNNMKIDERSSALDIVHTIIGDWETKINELNIVDVLKALANYPRDYHGKTYRFILEGLGISMEYDGIKHHTDGYKINKEKNYVNNFSTFNHSKYERPTGGPYRFLRRYFNNNLLKLKDFIKNEFGLELIENESGVYGTYIANNGTYIFSSDGVIYESNVSKKSEDVRQTIIQRPIAIKGVIETKFQAHGEDDQIRRQYIFYDVKSDTEHLIEFKPDVKKFNNDYGSYGLILTTNSTAVLLNMFVALNTAVERGEIYKYDCRELNGYYDDMYVIGDNAYDTDGNQIDTNEIGLVLRTRKIVTQPTQSEITVSEFGEMVAKLFSQREALVSFTTFIALLLGAKFWTPILAGYKQQVLIPGLFLSGISRSGKTTALTIFKNGFGLAYETKKYSIVSTTPQPLRQEATDDFILHLEEFTGDVGEMKETIVRDILNKSKTSRGEQDGSNLAYVSRSQLILDGEVLPESESVTNRCVMIPMFLQERIGNEKLLGEIMKYNYRRDFIKTLYNIDKSRAIEDFKESEKKLYDAGVRDRNLLLYSFLVTVNKWFSIYFENELIDAITMNITQQTSTDKDSSILSDLMADIIIKYRIKPTVGFLDKGDTVDTESKVIVITYTSDFKKKHKTYFIGAQKEFGENRVKFTPNAIKLIYDSNDKDPVNRKLYGIIMNFYQYYNITQEIISV